MLDTTAIRRLKNGDIGGLETLITRYQVKAVRTAFLIVHDEQLAEDIVQDAFIRIYQRIRGFDESRPFEPYLMRSVVNLALNTVRQQSMPEVIPDAELKAAQEKLKADGIEMDYTTSHSAAGGGGGGPTFNKLPEGMDQQEAYQRFLEALGYLYPGPWVFTINLQP